MPLELFNGLEQAFAWAAFTAGFVGEVYPDNREAMLGVAMMVYASANTAAGMLSSQIPARYTRLALLFAVTTQSVCPALVYWFYLNRVSIFAIACVLGMNDALLNTKISVLIGSDFGVSDNVVVVSVWRTFTAVGCAVPFFLSDSLTTAADVAGLAAAGGIAVVALAAYGIMFPSTHNNGGRGGGGEEKGAGGLGANGRSDTEALLQ